MGSCSRPSLASNIRQKPTKCLVSLATHGSEKSNNWLKKKRKPTPLRNLTHNMCTGVFLEVTALSPSLPPEALPITQGYRYLANVQSRWLSTGGEPSCGHAPCAVDPV